MTELVPQKAVTEIVDTVKNLPVFKKDDIHFLQENSKHLGQVMEHTQMWRTNTQKLSIINDVHFPTDHAKYHQAMLEQKVQFDQAMYLAKDFEMKKLEIEELECDLEELTDSKRDKIKEKKIQIDIQFKQYELKQMQTAMKYRMDEIKGWQAIENELLNKMRKEGMDEEEIWTKDQGEIQNMFLASLNNLQGLPSCTDSAERSNLISLAVFAYKQVKQAGLLNTLKSKCNPAQLDSIGWLKKHIGE